MAVDGPLKPQHTIKPKRLVIFMYEDKINI